MTKSEYYVYVGTNGILSSPIHLEGIPSVKKIELVAEIGKVLTKDNIHFFSKVITNDLELELWKEVDKPVGQ